MQKTITIFTQKIKPISICFSSLWHLFSYGRVDDRTNLDIKQSSMTMRSISCLFFFRYFFSPCQLFYLKNAIGLFSEWSFRKFVGIILFTIFIFIFSLLELTTGTILKLIALTIGGFITSYQALRLNSIGLWIDPLEIACNLSIKILDYKIFVTLGL